MPPKAKKTAKRTTRAAKAAPKTTAGGEELLRVEEEDDSNNSTKNLNNLESAPFKKEDEVKEDDFEKGERLEYLEDNEPEYEPEEFDGDYHDKEVDRQDVREEEGDEEDVEELEEGDLPEDEEEDIDEEDMEDVVEEIQDEDDAELADAGNEEHADACEEHDHSELIDATEEREHREVVKERRKRKEFEVFVGGLDKDATEEDLKEVFSAVGEVTQVRLMMNPQTKKNKGFAFLRFATIEQAKRAVTELKNPVVKGKKCGVTPSQDSDTLFLGNICKTWTKEKLREKLKHYGIENIEDLILVEDSNNEGNNRGFAFLEFSSRSDAMDTFKRLQKRDVLLGVDRPAKVSFADSFVEPGDEIMAQVTTVFIDGLPASWDEDRVRDLLNKFGEIGKIELARNMPSARRKDYGFVTFDSHDAAVTCAKSINNTELGEGDHKAKVRARLSRPLERNKGKNHNRGEYRGGRAAGRHLRAPWTRPLPPRPLPARVRGFGGRFPAAVDRGFQRPFGFRSMRPLPPIPARARPLPPPPRAYVRRAPAFAPPKSSLKRDYPRREELPPRSRAAADYGSRVPPERRTSQTRDEHATRAPAYTDLQRSSASRSADKRPYAYDIYDPRYERQSPPGYREEHAHDYGSISGSKRPYGAMDDVPSRYGDSGQGVRHSRARLDYDMPGGASHYGDSSYGDRAGRSAVGYSSRSSISAQDSHGHYNSRQGMGYGGSYGSSDVGGMYSSSFGSEYPSRGSDVGGNTYSNRGRGSGGYMGGSKSGSYY